MPNKSPSLSFRLPIRYVDSKRRLTFHRSLEHKMKSLLCVLFSGVLITLVICKDTNTTLSEDVLSCLRAYNMTLEEVTNLTFFNPNVTLSPAAKCFGACMIATEYNVSVSDEGIMENEGLLLSAIMEDTEIDFANATEVLDSCKNTLSPEQNTCENIYGYASCVNVKYFEKKGIKNFDVNILDQNDATTPAQ